MRIIIKILFFPFWLLKVTIALIACLLIVIFGLFFVFLGASIESVERYLKDVWNWGIRYEGIGLSLEQRGSVIFWVLALGVFFLFLYIVIWK